MTDNSSKNKINITIDDAREAGAVIKVIGVGGGGCNAINRMIEAGIEGVEFIVANTDIQALQKSRAQVKIQLGANVTKGLGAGSDPVVGRDGALAEVEKIAEVLSGADMVFVTTGLGGGTGTGAAPVVSAIASELDALTVAVVTKPFGFEGSRRMRVAEEGLAELRGCVDSVITIPNSKLSALYGKITLQEAFNRADDVLLHAVKGISGLITTTGTVNVDFADVKNVLKGAGVAIMGTGTAYGPGAAVEAMKQALECKLLEDSSISGATGALINFQCPPSTDLQDMEEAMSLVEAEAHEDAEIKFGTVFNGPEDAVTVTLIAAGFQHSFGINRIDLLETGTDGSSVRSRVREKTTKSDDLSVPTFIRRQAD